MNLRSCFFLLLLLGELSCLFPTVAQTPSTNGWQLEVGLRGQLVQALAQSSGQPLWAATDAGVFRYDGPGRLVPLNALRRGGVALPAVPCYSLVLTADGQLWLGTAVGVFRFGLTDGVLRPVPLPDPGRALRAVTGLTLAADGRHVWVAQEQVGLRRYTLNGQPDGPLLPQPRQKNEAWVAPDNTLWVSIEENRTRRYAPDGALLDEWSHPLRTLRPVAEPGSGRVWLLSNERLYQPAPEGRLVPQAAWRARPQLRWPTGRGPGADLLGPWAVRFPERPFGLARQDTTLVVFTANEVVQLRWAARAGGTPRLLRHFAVGPPVPPDAPAQFWALNNLPPRLWVDAAGRWWGFSPGYRSIWARAAAPAFVRPLAGPGGFPCSVRAVGRLPDGRLLASTYELGLLVQAPDSPLAPLRPWGYAGPGTGLLRTLMGVVPAAAGPGRTAWLAASDHEFLTLDPQTGRLDTVPTRDQSGASLPSPMPLALVRDPADGRVWGATSAGLFGYDSVAGDFRPYRPRPPRPGPPPLAGQVLDDVQADGRGHLWLATPAGVLLLTVATGAVRRFGNDAPAGPRRAALGGVRCLYLDRTAGRLWVGSRTEGLGLIDVNTGQARQVLTTANGLPDAHVASIVPGPGGTLWLGTYAGLVRYDPRSEALAVFTTADGLLSDECNARAAYADPRTGTLLVGGVAGLHRVYPAQAVTGRLRPRLVLTAYTPLDTDAPAARRQTRYRLATDSLPALALGPGLPVVDLHLALTDYADAGQARYFYRVGGWLGGRWLPLGATPVLRLQGLPPGRYTVEVRGETSQGLPAANTLRLPLTVTAEWWRRPVVWALGAALAVALVFGVQRQRLLRQRHDFRRRARLAADLHDEVGALLTRVTMQAELLRELEQATPARLDALVRDSRAAASTVRDIIWSVDAEADTLQALVDRLRDLLDHTAQATGQPVRFDGGGLPPDLARPLLPAIRQHVYLIAKEAVTNALRHAGPEALLTVALRLDSQWLELRVWNKTADAGLAPASRAGQGRRNMLERARLVRGILLVGPVAGGWEVALRVPV